MRRLVFRTRHRTARGLATAWRAGLPWMRRSCVEVDFRTEGAKS
jgi:hypothetical protein